MMKTIQLLKKDNITSVFLLFALCPLLFALSLPVSAQRFMGAVMGGMNISQVDGDEVYGYHRVGGHLGAAAILPIKNWDITLETVFNQKGAYQKPVFPGDSLNGQYDLRLNYIEVPLLAHYTDKKFITAGAGFSWGRLVSFKEIEHGGNQTPYADSVPFRKNDFNILVDAQIRVYKRLKFNVRFAYSLASIRQRTFDPYPGFVEPVTREQYNHLFTFRLVYVFNEIVPARKQREEPLE